MKNYEAKQTARKTHYIERAKKFEAEAQALYENDCREMAGIPFGQPILIGHHSENRHRAMLKRSQQRIDKIQKLNQKAEYYRQKAAINNRAISSDDEDAISKLKNKLIRREAYQVEMKRINNEYRKGGIDAITGLSEEEKAQFKAEMQLYHWQKKPFPSFKLTNNNAEIRRLKQRIAELETKTQKPAPDVIEGNGYKVIENVEDNRIWFEFAAKPIPAICKIMKQHGFKWSPLRHAWVRMLNDAGRLKTQEATKAIKTFIRCPRNSLNEP